MDIFSQEEKEELNPDEMKLTERFMIAMFSPGDYQKTLLRLSAKKMVGYFLCLILLLTVIWNVIPTVGAVAGMGGFRQIIEERIPDFELKDGNFFLNERIEIDDEQAGVYILIDTNEEVFTKEDVEARGGVVETILVSRTNAQVSSMVGGIGAMIQEYRFSDFGDLQMTNQDLIDMIPFYYVLMFVSFIAMYIGMGIRYMFSALFYTIFVFFMTRMLMIDNEFGEVYKTAMYAKTIGAIVEAVTYCIGSPLLIMAGSVFHFFITLTNMNRVYVKRVGV